MSQAFRLTFVAALLFVVGLAAYWPALDGFFLSDDFVHVQYMQRMDADIMVLLKNFWSNWLDVPTTLFYRPLVSVTLYADHLIWGWSPVGFHLTNVLMHAGTAVFIFLIARILSAGDATGRAVLFPALAALLFLLSPLHPEAVYWIIGRVDGQLALLYLMAVYLFMRHPTGARVSAWLYSSLMVFVAALMTKEPAVTLPAIIAAYAFFYPTGGAGSFWRCVLMALRRSAPFWVVLLAYFLWRRHVLGTFGGGYTEGGADYFSLDYWERWQALAYLVFPINRAWPESAETRHLMSWLFLAGWAGLAFAVVRGLQHARLRLRGLLFGLAAFVITLTPLVSVFSVASDLQSSRFLYLPAAFVWIAVAAGLGAMPQFSGRQCAGLAASVLLLFVSGWQLRLNLQPWVQASDQIRVFSQQLDEVAAERDRLSHGGMLVLAGIPDNIHGAQFLRNGYGGFLGDVFRPRRIDNLLPLTDHDRTGVMPIHARNMAADSSPWLFGVYRYLPGVGMQRVALVEDGFESAACSAGIGAVNASSSMLQVGDAWRVTGPDPYLVFDVGDCEADAVDALRVGLKYVAPQAEEDPTDRRLQVYWASEGKSFSEERSLSLPLQDGRGERQYLMPLGSAAAWDVGARLREIRLDFPSAVGGELRLGELSFQVAAEAGDLPGFSAARLAMSDLSRISQARYDPAKDVLALDMRGRDEFVVLPRQAWDPLRTDVLVVRMRVQGAERPAGKAKLYWRTEHSQRFSEDKSAEFAVRADGEWHTYRVSLKHLPTWWTMGRGEQLRLNPFYGAAKAEISSIHLDQARPQPSLALVDASGEVATDNPNGEVFRRASRLRGEPVHLRFQAAGGDFVLQMRAGPFPDPLRTDGRVKLELERELSGESGVVALDLSTLRGPGMRYLRVAPVGPGDSAAAFASDPVAILVED